MCLGAVFAGLLLLVAQGLLRCLQLLAQLLDLGPLLLHQPLKPLNVLLARLRGVAAGSCMGKA